MVDNILEGLVTKDSVNKEYYTKNADDYKTKLEGIDKKYRMTLKECKKNIFIHGGHFAFNYLAKRYNLTYVSAYKGIPDSEPSPKRIAELKTLMDQYGIRSVYYEELIAPRVAEILSRETGAGLLRLHGAHNISKSDLDNNTTFLSIMEDNLKSLKKGLECR